MKLSVSTDAGRTFSPVISLEDGNTHTPTVLAREQEGAVLLDLLFLAQGEEGTELHLIHWDDYGRTAPARHRLTEAVSESTITPPDPVWRDGIAILPPESGFRTTQVAWFGYDAAVSGDEVVVVVDEETSEGWFRMLGAPEAWFVDGLTGGAVPRDFTPAEPPPLAPGMTEPVPAPDPADMHQLKLLRLR
ncbi:MAG: hypothetical protein MUE73_10080 [Planctomycetes bacterium]|nr:hypothetical protein [Planctomycetota bacterium]